jgi:phosphodiesterase/alkaline phosphatase D-like protein
MTVRIILLDVRYNKTSLIFDNKADILGEEQWEWFENVLADNNETFTLIVSGTQILPFNRIVAIEAWYGSSRKRLFDLLGRLKKSGVILATGDIHAGEFLKSFCVLPGIF